MEKFCLIGRYIFIKLDLEFILQFLMNFLFLREMKLRYYFGLYSFSHKNGDTELFFSGERKDE